MGGFVTRVSAAACLRPALVLRAPWSCDRVRPVGLSADGLLEAVEHMRLARASQSIYGQAQRAWRRRTARLGHDLRAAVHHELLEHPALLAVEARWWSVLGQQGALVRRLGDPIMSEVRPAGPVWQSSDDCIVRRGKRRGEAFGCTGGKRRLQHHRNVLPRRAPRPAAPEHLGTAVARPASAPLRPLLPCRGLRPRLHLHVGRSLHVGGAIDLRREGEGGGARQATRIARGTAPERAAGGEGRRARRQRAPPTSVIVHRVRRPSFLDPFRLLAIARIRALTSRQTSLPWGRASNR